MSNITTPEKAIDAIQFVGYKLHGLAALVSIGEIDHRGLTGLDVIFSDLANQLEDAVQILDKKPQQK